jgi:hypothetical protein
VVTVWPRGSVTVVVRCHTRRSWCGWRDIAGIVIVIPLFAGALAWLATRSRLPMVRRVE